MNRRNFLGWLGTGLAAITHCSQSKFQKKNIPSGRWPVDLWWYAREVLHSYSLDVIEHPSPQQNSQQFLESVIQHWEGSGTAYLWEIRNQFGIIVSLWVLSTDKLVPCPPCVGHPDGHYSYRLDDNGFITLSAHEVRKYSLVSMVREREGEVAAKRVTEWLWNRRSKV